MINIMGIDQFGETYHGLGKYPRKELMARLGSKHADKMYVDLLSGKAKHVGYIVARKWVALFHVTPWEKQDIS